jgi:hypothetical protein
MCQRRALPPPAGKDLRRGTGDRYPGYLVRFIVDPEGKARKEIVIAGYLIIISEAFRAMSCESRRDTRFQFGEFRVQHLLSSVFV